MSHTFMLSHAEVARLAPMATCIDLMHDLNRQLGSGSSQFETPLRCVMPLFDSPPQAFLGLMPAATWQGAHQRFAGVKCLSVFPHNGAGLGSHQGVYVLFDGQTGAPLLVADARQMTGLRTAANSAVALRTLAPAGHGPLCVGVVGSGEQAALHAQALTLAMAQSARPVQRVLMWGRSPSKLQACIQATQKLVPHVTVRAASVPEVMQSADAVCTVTAAAEPVVTHAILQHRTRPLLLIAVGACRPDVRELDTALVQHVHRPIVVDNRVAALHEAGDLILAQQHGAFAHGPPLSESLVELSHCVTSAPPPQHDGVVLYKSLGFGAQDLRVAMHLYAHAGAHANITRFCF